MIIHISRGNGARIAGVVRDLGRGLAHEYRGIESGVRSIDGTTVPERDRVVEH